MASVDGGGLPLTLECASQSSAPRPPTQTASSMLFVSVLVCCVSPLLFGYSMGFTSPAQATMEGDMQDGVAPPEDLSVFSTGMMSVYASLVNVGAVLGAFSGSVLSDRLGRRTTLALTGLPHLVAWIVTSATSNGSVLLVVRLLVGWGVGVGSAVAPCYISEVATTGLRGSLGAANQLSVTIGIFVANLMGSFVFVENEQGEKFCQWRHMCLFGAGLALVLFMCTGVPESPKWLASKGKLDAARAALSKLRMGDISAEMQELAEAAPVNSQGTDENNHQISTMAMLRANKKSLVIGIGLCGFQQLSGVNAVIFYTSKICQQAGMEDPSASAMYSMAAQVLLTGVSCLLMEKAGRRLLMLFASSCMAFACFALGYYFLAHDQGLWGPPWLALAALGIYILGFSMGMGPIPWLILGEIFPTEVRGVASSLATATNWTLSFLVTLVFAPLEEAITVQGTFAMFGIIMCVCFLFVTVLVPETKGKSTDEVLAMLNGRRAFTNGPK